MRYQCEKIRLITFYLPQFYPIPENDEWWGKGFTDWRNVAMANPLFEGHYQPHIPADLGFYDLRLPEVRRAQADFAREYGIYGFCYYHYWFNGKRLLERPFEKVLKTGEPDFPFCLCWANEDWTRAWDGETSNILIKQTYSAEDDQKHIHYLLKCFDDRRYIRINARPLFIVYRSNRFPDPLRTAEIWREEATKHGLPGLYLCRVESFRDEHMDPQKSGFDASIEFQPDWCELGPKLRGRKYKDHSVYRYEDVLNRMLKKIMPKYKRFSCVTPSWDNSPRRKNGAVILIESAPDLYERWLRETIKKIRTDNEDEKIVFINAWNEWGEGNHLEPDQKYGKGYLEATRRALML